MAHRRNLTPYRLARHIDGVTLDDPALALRDVLGVVCVEQVEDLPFAAWLYRPHSPLKTPQWVEFLQEGLDDDFTRVRSASAVLFVRALNGAQDFFASTFGRIGRSSIQ